jgi:CcmD family protein
MGTFVAGFIVVWLAVVLYVARLGRAQRRLLEKCDALHEALASMESEEEIRSRAA